MSVFLSLLTAALYGSADFCGGLATARTKVASVLLGAHACGLVGISALALAIADGFSWRDMGLGALGGVAGLAGVFLLYRRLAVGPMHVVAPLSGVTSAAVTAFWGVLTGERLSSWSWIGIALALVAIVLVSIGSERSSAPVTAAVVFESLLSGLGFGTFFVFLDATTSEGAPWPVAGARLVTVAILAGVVVAARRRAGFAERAASDAGGRARPASLGLWALIAWAGLADTGANATFLFAAQQGDLVVVSVLSSFYPISTVVLARIVLGDRMSTRQFVGFAAALIGTGLIVGG